MMRKGIEGLLERAAALAAAGKGAPPALYLVDASGKEIASAVPPGSHPRVAFAARPGGAIEPLGLAAPWTARIQAVRTWGTSGPSVALLHRSRGNGKALDRAFDFAVEAISLCLDRVFEIESLSGALTRLFEERSILSEIGREIGEADDLREFCRRLAPRLAEVLGAQRVAVALRSRDRSEFVLLGVHGLGSGAEGPWKVGQGVTGRSIERGMSRLLENVSELPPDALPFEAQGRRDLYVTPVREASSGRAMGAILALDSVKPAGFGSEETTLLDFVAEYVGSVLTGIRGIELKKEIEIARRIVEGLLPGRPPAMRGVELAGRLRPASEVGGDYYDFLRLGDGRVGLVVADVSGHNLPATLLMTSARSAFRWEAGGGRSAAEILSRVARHLHDDLVRADLFMSMALVLLDEEGGGIEYANAGHPAPLLRRRDGSFEELFAEGPVAGVIADARFEESRHDLRPGDCLLLYTDGLTEAARDGEFFGIDRLRRALERGAAARSAEGVVEAVFGEVEAFCGGPSAEDVTVAVARALDGRTRAEAPSEEAR